MQSLIPVVMSGIIAVYALVVAVLIAGNMKPPPEMEYSLFNGCMHLACGLSVGLTGLAAGYAIGVVGDAVRGTATKSKRTSGHFLLLSHELMQPKLVRCYTSTDGVGARCRAVSGSSNAERRCEDDGRLTGSIGSTRVHAAVTDIRRHGTYTHFRRSAGSLWVSLC